jgi:hypothetical protein
MRIRGTIAAAALAGAGLLALPASADESCHLLTDATNDTAFGGRAESAGVAVQQPLDIVSADVATAEGWLYAVIRVQALERASTTNAYPTTYRLELTAGTRKIFVQATSVQQNAALPVSVWAATSYAFTAGRVGVRAYRANGALDMEGNEIRVEAPVEAFGRDTILPGVELGGLTATTVRTYSDHGQLAPGVGSKVTVSDTATSTATYVADSESCMELVIDSGGWFF